MDAKPPKYYPACAVKAAAALSYDQALMSAPQVCASGKHGAAKKLREIARRFGVPVVNKPELAHELCELSENSPIPPSLYREVAHILVKTGKDK